MTPTELARSTAARDHLEPVAVEVARLAADLVRTATGRARAAGTKSSPTDVVTHTDLESEVLIRANLVARSPGSTIIGEEQENQLGSNGLSWIVDPIDGTVNFLYDLPVTAVSIAAEIDGRVVAGAVTDVHRREVFSATLGKGARRDGHPIRSSSTGDLATALIGTGFSYDASIRARQADLLTRVLPAARDIRCMGSAALNLCWVACGRLDGFFEEDLKVYDFAAGALIAAEAGATVQLPEPARANTVVAAAPGIAESLQALLGPPG